MLEEVILSGDRQNKFNVSIQIWHTRNLLLFTIIITTMTHAILG